MNSNIASALPAREVPIGPVGGPSSVPGSSTENHVDHAGIHITELPPEGGIGWFGNVARSEISPGQGRERDFAAARSEEGVAAQSVALQRFGAVTASGDLAAREQVPSSGVQCDSVHARSTSVIATNNVDEKKIGLVRSGQAEGSSWIDDLGFELIQEARRLLEVEISSRAALKTTEPSLETIAQYKRKCRLVDEATDDVVDSGGAHLVQKLARYAYKSASFFAMRAALKWRALDRLKRLVTATSHVISPGGTDLNWGRFSPAFRHVIQDFKAIDNTSRDVCLDWSGRKRQAVASKRKALGLLPDDWRDQFLEVSSQRKEYRSQILLMRFVGFRPQELSIGVTARLAGDFVEVIVRGAKVRAGCGQEWRKVQLSASVLPDWFLEELHFGNLTIYTAETGPMRAHLKRLSESLFPRGRKNGRWIGPLVSGYVFRHALATDLREEGWDDQTIAGVLGESVAETTRLYGLRATARSKRKIKIAINPTTVETARPVRARAPVDPGLLAKLKRKM